MRTLPNDIARCNGAGDAQYFDAQCCKCLRYTQRVTDNPRQAWMTPPMRIDGKCPKFEGDMK